MGKIFEKLKDRKFETLFISFYRERERSRVDHYRRSREICCTLTNEKNVKLLSCFVIITYWAPFFTLQSSPESVFISQARPNDMVDILKTQLTLQISMKFDK